MTEIDRLDRRLSDVEKLLYRLKVDHNSGRIYLSNVLNFQAIKSIKDSKDAADKELEVATAADFEAIQQYNQRLKEKREKERQAKNRQVLRDYKIKGK